MSSDQKLSQESFLQLLEGVKLRKHMFGDQLASPLVTIHSGSDAAGAASSAERLTIRWQDSKLGVAVLVQEQPDGRVHVDVHSNDPNHLDRAWLSVVLAGAINDQTIRKSIPLKVPEPNGCSGSADYGLLADVVAELGPQLRVIVILALA